MSKINRKTIALMLVIAVILTSLILPLGISAAETLEVSEDRFLGNEIECESLLPSKEEDGSIRFRILGRRSSLTILGCFAKTGMAGNALRLCVSNATNASILTVTFEDGDGQSGSVPLEVIPNSGMRDYYVYYPFSDIQKVRIEPEGITAGEMTLHALQSVALNDKAPDPCGAVTTCRFDSSGDNILVEGYITIRMMSAHPSSRIGLFLLDFGMDYNDFLNLETKDAQAEAEIANSFSFSVKVREETPRLLSCLVCIIDPDGTYIPVTAPRVVELYASSKAKDLGAGSFKGILSPDYALPMSMHPGHTVIDVRLDQLFDMQSGDSFSIRNHTFFFNQTYLASLREKIDTYVTIGTEVYLRLLISGKAPLPVTDIAVKSYVGTGENQFRKDAYDMPSAPNGAFIGLTASTQSERVVYYAAVRYLCVSFSGISGLILGKSLNDPLFGHFIGTTDRIAYVKEVAKSLMLVSNAAREAIPDIRIVIPVMTVLHDAMIESHHLDGTDYYDTAAFLYDLAPMLTNAFGGDSVFTVMYQTDAMPNAVFSDIVKDRKGSASSFYPGPGDAGFDRIFDSLPEGQIFGTEYMMQWNPRKMSGETLSKAFAEAFCGTLMQEKCGAFLTDLTDVGTGMTDDLTDLILSSDTELRNAAFDSLADSYEDIGDDSMISQVQKAGRGIAYTLVNQTSVPKASVESVGNYLLWNFATALSTRGWMSGPNCGSLRIGNAATRYRTLQSDMTLTGSTNRAFILAKVEDGAPLTAGEYLNVSLGLTDGEGSYYVSVVLGSEDYMIRCEKEIGAGRTDDIVLDIRNISSGASYICISVEGKDGAKNVTLNVDRIEVLSTTMDSDALAAFIESIDQPEQPKNSPTPLLILLILSFVILEVIIFLTLILRKSRENGKSKKTHAGFR